MQYVDKAELSVPVEKKSKIVDNFLKGLLAEHGKVTVQMIVDEAAAPKSPIHKFFEWNDTEAGRKYREKIGKGEESEDTDDSDSK